MPRCNPQPTLELAVGGKAEVCPRCPDDIYRGCSSAPQLEAPDVNTRKHIAARLSYKSLLPLITVSNKITDLPEALPFVSTITQG